MALQMMLNVIIALLWMFLQESYTFVTLTVGYVIGLLLLFILRRFIPGRFYGKTLWAMIRLFFLFVRELLVANWDVVKVVYSPKMNTQPGIFRLQTDLQKNWQITLLANLISLTPGTLSLVVSDDRKIIYIHAMNIQSTEAAAKNIKQSFEKLILELI
ncbi:Na+/H+ antiporter subunit E [Bacillaceae bacterium SIJ1]|uniref:Na+/H+ antiporter subunit E n=1 Tax=Litoribacterium kuwaitense TaxID=1398745 RepID=UPI0013ED1E5D|nr:Na+/H+ antiporter subunit E [Litoribacterium kuwaitense]NGP43478.1 Na+/H+ antiporter subunit E [Litoribacterium kuwaitense]